MILLRSWDTQKRESFISLINVDVDSFYGLIKTFLTVLVLTF
jgi:hypothetical protein